MAKNEILPFGLNSSANVLSPAEWSALSARNAGFTTGIAKSKEMNTALRQSSVIANVVAQFIADNSGKDVLDNGDLSTLQKNLSAALLSSMPGRLLNIQMFTSSGSYSPTAGTKRVRVKVWGAGGGGQGMSSTSNGGAVSGGSGAYAESLIDVTGVASISVTVGVGGVAAVAGNNSNGGSGGRSLFGGYITCEGGLGGNQVGVSWAQATGGTLLNINGQSGQGGTIINNSGAIIGGIGGGSFGSANALPHISVSSDAGQFPGGGGAMGTYISASQLQPSGKGANGYVIVEEYS
ncbi:glycine-rich domain-containing protein [Serratia sp. D1N4]